MLASKRPFVETGRECTDHRDGRCPCFLRAGVDCGGGDSRAPSGRRYPCVGPLWPSGHTLCSCPRGDAGTFYEQPQGEVLPRSPKTAEEDASVQKDVTGRSL